MQCVIPVIKASRFESEERGGESEITGQTHLPPKPQKGMRNSATTKGSKSQI